MAKYKVGLIGSYFSSVLTITHLISKFLELTPKNYSLEIILFKNLTLSSHARQVMLYLDPSIDFNNPKPGSKAHLIKWYNHNTSNETQKDNNLFLHINYGILERYIDSIFSDTLKQITDTKIKIHLINGDIKKIKKFESDGKYYIKLLNEKTFYEVDKAILCPENLPVFAYQHFKPLPSYLSSLDLAKVKTIPTKESIHIIGDHFKAIDTIFELTESGHTGKIYILTDNHLFPCVSGTIKQYHRKFLTLETIFRHIVSRTEHLKLETLEKLLWDEIRNAEDNSELSYDLVKSKLSNSLEHWLEAEINEIKIRTRPWQSVIASLYFFMLDILNFLSVEDNFLFLKKYYELISVYTIGISFENACRVLELLKSGQLKVITNLDTIIYNADQSTFDAIDNQNNLTQANYLIDASNSQKYIH